MGFVVQAEILLRRVGQKIQESSTRLMFRVHLLGFLPGQYTLSQEMEETRAWFITRLLVNATRTGLPGVWTDEARAVAFQQIVGLARELKTGYHI